MFSRFFERCIGLLDGLGHFGLFCFRVFWVAFQPPYRPRLLIQQMFFVGVGSLFIVLLTGLFSGAVFSLQSSYAFSRFGAEGLVGSTVAISLTRELAPVFCSLLVTGRVGSAMATEIGTMRVTEQIDALETLAVDPIHYLVVPRVVAAFLMLPVLTLLFDLIGILGSYAVCIGMLQIDAGIFWNKIWWYLDPDDIYGGLIKGFVFGGILSLLGCYRGYQAAGGARGVGEAATKAVVASSVSILVIDYLLTILIYEIFLGS